MAIIYSKAKQDSRSKHTIFQISPELKYKLYENEDGFRWVRFQRNGDERARILWLDIPREIAHDLGIILMKGRQG